jgi:CPA2 family monovalent cation:H+ antiporter-2
METLTFLIDLAWVIGLGALVTAIFQRLKQPLVLGYLLAGLLLNARLPFFPNLQRISNIEVLGQLGIVFIMFFVGLQFHFRKLRQVGFRVLMAGILEVTLVTWLGFITGQLLGFKVSESLFFGALFCTSSTTIIVKSLSDEGKLGREFASVIIGITLVEDVAAVGILVFLSGLSATGTPSLGDALTAASKVVAFSAGAVGLGLAVVPRFLRWVNRFGGGEPLTLVTIGICLTLSASALKLGFSSALGAFLSGTIIAESGIADKLEQRLLSVRDLFLAVFFVTIGLQFHMTPRPETVLLVGAGLLVALVGRMASCLTACLLSGYDLRTALNVGLSMAVIGELSFVIANLGVTARAAPEAFFSMAIAIATVTAFTTPFFIRRGEDWARRFESALPASWQTLLMRYQSWVQALSWPMSRLRLPRHLYPLAGRAALLILLMAGAVYANRAANVYLADHRVHRILWEGDTRFFREAFFGLVYLSLYLLSLNTLKQLFRQALQGSGERMDPKGQVLLSLSQFVSAFVIGILFLAFASPFVSATTLLLVVLGVVLTQLGVLRQTLTRMETRFDGLVKNIVSSYGMAESSSGEVRTLMKERYPWNASITDFILPTEFCGVDRTLADLRLRKRTGASVIAVYRGEACITNPEPDFQLLPSDVLVLLGEKEHLESASNYLRECCRQPHPQMAAGGEGFHLDTARVPQGSLLAGKTLSELAFRNLTGASVVGLERAGVRYTTMLPETILEVGDVLLLLGKPKEVAYAQGIVEGKESSEGLISAAAQDHAEEAFGRG